MQPSVWNVLNCLTELSNQFIKHWILVPNYELFQIEKVGSNVLLFYYHSVIDGTT